MQKICPSGSSQRVKMKTSSVEDKDGSTADDNFIIEEGMSLKTWKQINRRGDRIIIVLL